MDSYQGTKSDFECDTETLLRENLKSVETLIYLSYNGVQIRHLIWGKNASQALEISRKKADIPPERGGPSTVCFVRVHENGVGELVIAGEQDETFISCSPSDSPLELSDELKKALEKLSDNFVFCSGLSESELKVTCPCIGHASKRYIKKSFPFERLSSTNCSKWFALSKFASKKHKEEADLGDSVCPPCNKLYRQLRYESKQFKSPVLETKKRRTQTDSNYPISLLSPSSKSKRYSNLRAEKVRTNQKLQRLMKKVESYTLELNEDQSVELSDFLGNLKSEDVDDAFENVKQDSSADIATSLRAAFEADQSRNSKLNKF